MTRDIQFTRTGPLAWALGITKERNAELESFIGRLIEKKASLRDVVTALNERGDLTDAEWTGTIYGLGYYHAMQNFNNGGFVTHRIEEMEP